MPVHPAKIGARFLSTFSGSGGSRGRMTRRRGFTLIELLIVVAIIVIIVAISLVNMINAIQRVKLKRSMGYMKSLATAIEGYATDQNSYPAAAGLAPASGSSPP